jgi:DNA-binding IscR family transcriptional regulator
MEVPSCERKSWCPAHQVWAEAQAAVVNVLGAASMDSLASQAKANSAALYELHDKTVWISGAPKKGRVARNLRTPGH